MAICIHEQPGPSSGLGTMSVQMRCLFWPVRLVDVLQELRKSEAVLGLTSSVTGASSKNKEEVGRTLTEWLSPCTPPPPPLLAGDMAVKAAQTSQLCGLNLLRGFSPCL